jgi:hypothetical protein
MIYIWTQYRDYLSLRDNYKPMTQVFVLQLIAYLMHNTPRQGVAPL